MSSARMEQGMRQSMIATAQMQMYMRALAANRTELEQMVSEAIATNPVLEEDRRRELAPQESSGTEYALATERHERFLHSITAEESLSEHLAKQIQQSGLGADVEHVALYLVDNLNDKGYFDEAPLLLTREIGIAPDVAQQAILAIQDLEPAGVGALDLQESLLLQLEHLGEAKGIAHELIKEHWDCLITHRYGDAAKHMELEEEAIIGAARRISKLNPDPGSAFCSTDRHIITADVIVERDGTQLSVRLNQEGTPQLSLSADYRSMMAEKAENAELRRYLSKCFREGRDLIRAIEQRQQSVLEVSRALVVRQQAFFLEGPHAIAPMKMEQLAQDTDMHISTISRAVRNKYLRCEHGLFELRSFFTTGLSQSAGEGDIAAGAVQSRIRALIESEDKKKPLSDSKLEKALAAEGIQIARRTIAKYREQMKILPASLRKS